MAYLIAIELVTLFVAWLLYNQFTTWMRWRSLKKWGEQYGCCEAPSLPNKLPGGVERYGVFFTGSKGIQIFSQQSPESAKLELDPQPVLDNL